jgi:hypothetical protein
MKSVILNAEEIKQLQSKGAVMKRVAMRPQPFYKYNMCFWGKGNRIYGMPDEKTICVAALGLWNAAPYRVNDSLCVKETWRVVGWHEGEPLLLQYKSDGARLEEPHSADGYDEDKYTQLYIDCSDDCEKSGAVVADDELYHFEGDPPTRWRSPVTMPQWASRYVVTVESVTAECVNQRWVWVYELRLEK